MKILYIFPHPDDESFGPAPAISQQKRNGHEVYLLTLTKGGATKQRFEYDYSVEKMGEVRAREMQEVAKVLQLDDLTIHNFPDNGLKELAPQDLEQSITAHIRQIQPDVIVTYAVHGVSGFPDHLVTHAVVKRCFTELRSQGRHFPQRLALFTLSQDQATTNEGKHQLKYSPEKDIDCVLNANDQDVEAMEKALAQYKTYQKVIEETQVKETVGTRIYFEFFQESFSPPLSSLTAQL